MKVVIYGASDDLVEVDGDLREEFYARRADEEDGADYVALSCGTLLKVSYDGDWSVRVEAEGRAAVARYPYDDGRADRAVSVDGTLLKDVPDYSDAVVVEADEIAWVVLGSEAVTPATSVPRIV